MPDNTGNQFQVVQNSAGVTPNSVAPVSDPGSARLRAAGLLPGGANSPTNSTLVSFRDPPAVIAPENDWRVRVSVSPQLGLFYLDANNPIMAPLSQTSGVIFPYTPQITVQHTARYGTSQLTHSNYPAYFYEGSEVAAITITGEFTVQNIPEGQYLMAVIQFFRSVSKMFFGSDQQAGNPPPMLFLDGYGTNYFPHVSCVLTTFSHTMPADVDYVEIPIVSQITSYVGQGAALPTRLPTHS